jgi:hypothetical protein
MHARRRLAGTLISNFRSSGRTRSAVPLFLYLVARRSPIRCGYRGLDRCCCQHPSQFALGRTFKEVGYLQDPNDHLWEVVGNPQFEITE